ncbi:tyrosine recombinase XerC [Luteitalea pratensis]|uniref:Tyrosine recombinase XerC n=1 Tax=Luteitalea pratensis TaxID=1855912 RepID=A0A143PPS9_LUTPR|nr:tyrosine-type recombinase/integrase [Luteitalea pratensis]AMY10128.1 tyrosine recombinase XerC [Luteitalea pratensis]
MHRRNEGVPTAEGLAAEVRAEKLIGPGITDLHFHDLRREFASRLLDGGTPLTVISAYLGHASTTTTARYLAADFAARGDGIAGRGTGMVRRSGSHIGPIRTQRAMKVKSRKCLILKGLIWCRGAELNRRHNDFQTVKSGIPERI